MCLKKVKKDEVIMVPIHRKWIENVAKLADKTVTSSRVAFTLFSAVVLPNIVGKKKLQQEDLVASTSSLQRCREKFQETKSKIEKQVESEHQVDKSKTYIAVCISATNGSIPGSDLKEKILDIVPMDKSDSETTFNTLVKVLNETSPNLVKCILGGVFDTTNTNSGCRHHIYKRIAIDICKAVLGNSKSPETDMHKRLRDNWLSLNLDEPESFFVIT